MKNKLLLITAILLCIQVFAQRSFLNNADVFGTRVFIENKGQFDDLKLNDQKILYGIDNGEEQIYFTPKGVVFVVVKRNQTPKEEHESLEGKKSKRSELDRFAKPNEIYKVFATWKNINPNVQVIESEKQNHYFTYGDASKNASCFKKITYVNAYPNIDIEYIIADNKSSGIKYNVIVHPGADISKINLSYSGDITSMFLNNEGNVMIQTPHIPLMEHKPISFQGNKVVKTEFLLNDKEISFKFNDAYDPAQTLTIDPWVTAITSILNNNYGYDVDYDNWGNTFVYGATNNNKLAKYNNLGALQWTFAGQMTSPAWVANGYTGNFVVHKPSGKSYVGKCFGATGLVIRLDQNGNYDNLMSSVTGNSWPEIWDMAYHCSTGKIYGFGGGPSTINSAGIIDQVTGSVTPIGFFPNNGNAGHDVVSHAIDNTGEIFFLYASYFSTPFMDNRIARINSAFTSSVWLAPTGFTPLVEWHNKNFYVGGPGIGSSNGFNALAANSNYLYYYDGYNLAAYNKNTGGQIAATTITGYGTLVQGGIAVDDCDNLYIGGNNGNILSYKFTGTSFVALPGLNLNVTTPNKYVYDIKYDKPTNQLYFSGSGFVGVTGAINSATCPLVADCNFQVQTINANICYGAVATISIANTNSLTNPSYSIQPGGQSQSSPLFTVSPSVSTSYTLFITGVDSQNAVVTQTGVSTVSVFPVPVVVPTLVNGTCANPITSSVNLNVAFTPSGSPNYTVNWNPIPTNVTTVNSGTASGLIPGLNQVTVTTANGCSTTASFSVPPVPQPASFVIVNPSNDYTVTCLNPNVVLTTSVTNGVPLSFTWFP
ncbi:MAG: hypothetical protein ACK50A_05775, partial [Sphingobacteriaceae bacterium]